MKNNQASSACALGHSRTATIVQRVDHPPRAPQQTFGKNTRSRRGRLATCFRGQRLLLPSLRAEAEPQVSYGGMRESIPVTARGMPGEGKGRSGEGSKSPPQHLQGFGGTPLPDDAGSPMGTQTRGSMHRPPTLPHCYGVLSFFFTTISD